MKFLPFAVLVLLAASFNNLIADDLTVTLPTGKTITFQSAEQKARFEAAIKSQAAKNTSVEPPVQPTPTPRPPEMGHTALDEKPTSAGSVNFKAPQFTADYYLRAPETWLGKHIALSVGYIDPTRLATTKDGLEQLPASTYNVAPGSSDAHKVPGGKINILATSEVADRLTKLCGTKEPAPGELVKTVLIQGQLHVIESNGPSSSDAKQYGFYVEK